MYIASAADVLRGASALLALRNPIALDLETTRSLNPRKGHPLTVGVGDRTTRIIIRWSQVEALLPALSRLLDGKRTVVGANLAYDHKWLRHWWGLRLERVFDVLIAHKALTCGLPAFDNASLKDVAFHWLAVDMDKGIREQFYNVDPEAWQPTPEEVAYMEADLSVPLQLWDTLLPRIQELHLEEALRLRMGMVPILGDMEYGGAPVNKTLYQREIDTAQTLLTEAESEVVEQLTPPVVVWRQQRFDEKFNVWKEWKDEYERVKAFHEDFADRDQDWPSRKERRAAINEQNRLWKDSHPEPPKPKLQTGGINLNSPDQVLGALNGLGYPFRSTRAEEFEEYIEQLTELGDTDPILAPFIRYKALQKLTSAFGQVIIDRIEDGLIHPEWNAMVSTGRGSCSKPNLQQVPKPVKIGNVIIDIRRAFEAPEGYVIGRLDLSNIEARIAADQSGDAQMIEDFCNNLDMHGRVAARKLGISYEDGQRLKAAHDADFSRVRDASKIKNYATFYGAWDQEHIATMSATYPVFWTWLQNLGAQAVESKQSRAADGFIKSWRLDPEPKPRYSETWKEWRKRRNRIVRQAKNFPIQSTSAAIIWSAAIAVYHFLRVRYPLARIWNIVHDELDILIPVQYAPETVMAEVKELAERAGQTYLRHVPCVADATIAPNWAETK